MNKVPSIEAIKNCLLGLMLGDTLGLPYEGISPKRIKKLSRGRLSQGLVMRKGMVSDDTEHAFLAARSLCKSESPETFGRSLLWGLKWWLLRLPGGVGLATGRALIKSWIGFPYGKNGVFSAGNGPAMRAPILGVVFGHDSHLLKSYMRESTRLTHTDPKAYIGALAVAQAAYNSSVQCYDLIKFKAEMRELLSDIPSGEQEEFWRLIGIVESAVNHNQAGIPYLIDKLGQEKGVGGYVYHTVPVVLALFFIYKGDFKAAITRVIELGGDTDTTAAILGGIVGAGVPSTSLPSDWLNNIWDYPCSVGSLTAIATKLHLKITNNQVVKIGWLLGPLILLRNLFFLAVVLAHGFRRLLPPY